MWSVECGVVPLYHFFPLENTHYALCIMNCELFSVLVRYEERGMIHIMYSIFREGKGA